MSDSYSIIYKNQRPILLEHKSCCLSFKEIGAPTDAELFFWNALNEEVKKYNKLFDELSLKQA